jgi:hypothetical protein
MARQRGGRMISSLLRAHYAAFRDAPAAAGGPRAGEKGAPPAQGMRIEPSLEGRGLREGFANIADVCLCCL